MLLPLERGRGAPVLVQPSQAVFVNVVHAWSGNAAGGRKRPSRAGVTLLRKPTNYR